MSVSNTPRGPDMGKRWASELVGSPDTFLMLIITVSSSRHITKNNYYICARYGQIPESEVRVCDGMAGAGTVIMYAELLLKPTVFR